MNLEDLIDAIKPSLCVNPPVANGNADIPAAILMLFAQVHGEVCMGLIKRAQAQEPHSGQISFPGGRMEKEETALETALRETQEEIGVNPALVEVTGFMPATEKIVTGYTVWLVVGTLREIPEIITAPAEVEEFFWAPLSFFMESAVTMTNFGKPAFVYRKQVIWGFTFRIIRKLVRLLLAD